MTKHTFGPGVGPTVAAALQARGITSLFPIQQQVAPVADEGRDILARSPTGSGKTIAFGIPLVQALDHQWRGIQSLVLVPTRELALQVADELMTLDARVRVATAFGGVKQGPQVKRLADAQVLVACPGRLEDLMQQRLVDLRGVHTLVLDEADRMLDMGFLPTVERILAKVPRDRQTMLFSATLDDRILDVAARHTEDPVSIATAPPKARPVSIDHAFLPCVHEDKTDLLLDLLDAERPELAVVFVRTKRGAARIAKRITKRGVKATALHGDMLQGARVRELGRFERGEVNVLVATDVFARGIDLDRIELVVNFDPPGEAEDYVHRAGRTGRAGRDGLAVTFVLDDQRADVQQIADALGLVEEFTRNGLEHVPVRTSTPRTAAADAGGASGRSRRRRRGRATPQRSGSPA